MAEAGTIDVVINASTSGLRAGLNDAQRAIEGAIPSITRSVAIMGAAITGALTASVYAFTEAEEAATGLAVALRNQGDATKKTLADLLDFDTQLSKHSNFSDEEIARAQTYLAMMGLQGAALKRATQAAVDLATQTGNLSSASRILGNAYEGMGTGLRRFGIIIEEGAPAVDVFNQALGQIEQKLGGRAAADAATLGGQIKQIFKALEEAGEALGGVLEPAVKQIVSYLLSNQDALENMAVNIGRSVIDITNKFIDFINFFIKNTSQFSKVLDFFYKLVGALKDVALFAAKGYEQLYNLFQWIIIGKGDMQSNIFGGAMGTDTSKIDKAAQGSGVLLPHLKYGAGPGGKSMAERINVGAAKEPVGAPDKSFVKEWEKAWDEVQGITRDAGGKIISRTNQMAQDLKRIFTGLQNALASGINGFFQDILLNGKNLGQALMNIGMSILNFFLQIIAEFVARWIMSHIIMKAASLAFHAGDVAQATTAAIAKKAITTAMGMDEISAAMGVAWANSLAAYSFIPFAGQAMGQAAYTAMLPSFAGAGSLVMLAKGGIIDRPTFAMLGETGQKEAVVNLESREGKKALKEAAGGSGGGEGVHIHLEGMLIEGDAAKWERITRNVIVPALERHGRKTRNTKGKIW